MFSSHRKSENSAQKHVYARMWTGVGRNGERKTTDLTDHTDRPGSSRPAEAQAEAIKTSRFSGLRQAHCP
jgi:hypothetical protein